MLVKPCCGTALAVVVPVVVMFSGVFTMEFAVTLITPMYPMVTFPPMPWYPHPLVTAIPIGWTVVKRSITYFD